MSEILNSFVVENNNINFTPETNNLTLTPNAIQLNIYTAAGGSPGVSNNGQLLFNNANVIFGVANSNALGGNLRFTNLANLKIDGGANAYFLQTDGTGNLTWAAGTANVSGNGTAAGANTQIQISDGAGNFTSGAGFTFDTASNLFSAPGNANIVNAVNANLVNANTISGTSGNITTLSANFVGTAFLTTVNNANVGGNLAVTGTANINVDCNVASNVYANLFVGNGYYLTSINGANVSNVANANYANFAGNSTNSNNANYANFAGNVVNATQPNITSLGILTDLRISNNILHLGNGAGANTQGANSIAIGTNAGANNQGINSIAIGLNAGANSLNGIAIGQNAGSNLSGGIAIGYAAGEYAQKGGAVALGEAAGANNQGNRSVAIGYLAGTYFQGDAAIAIGSNAGPLNQHTNSIIINATDANLDSDGANRFFVKPVRNINTANVLFYNASSGEITYSSNISFGSLSNGTSNVSIPTANGNVVISVNGNTALTITDSNIITPANISASRFVSNVATGTAPLTVSSTTKVTNLYVDRAGISDTSTVTTTSIISGNGNGFIPFVLSSTTGNLSLLSNINLKYNPGTSTLHVPTLNSTTNISATNITSNNANVTTLGTVDTTITGTAFFGNFAVPTANGGGSLGLTGQRWNNAFINNVTVTTNMNANYVKTISTTVASLANAITSGAGTRAFVTDANTTTFLAIVGGGGANKVPVVSDGTNWLVG